ncbi:MAG: MATE family efflux transporter [Lachnospiraceae bacterium]|nr:MATE family efflux transporter [Lachnospiraceae bacterium]
MSKSASSTQFMKMTETPIPRLVLMLSVPSILSMLVTNVYNLVDTAFVGRLGTSASGAVGIVFGFMSIIQAFGFMFGQGSGSILSRAPGRQDREAASVHASVGFFGAFSCGLIISILGFLFLDDIVMFLGSTDTIAPFAKTYISFILASAPFMCSSFTLNNMLRYEGKAYLGMIGLMSGAVLNMAGDPILMFGLGMGIAGAGLSTALSQLVSWGILISMFLTGRTESRLHLSKAISAGPAIAANIMATGFPSLLRQGLNSIATVVLNSQCKFYGDAAVAAMSIVLRIVFFTFSIALGVGQGFQPVSAFNYGARKYSRIREGYRFTMLFAEGIILAGVAVLVVFAAPLVGMLRDDPDVIAIGTRALRLLALANLLLPPCMVTEMLYQSTGHRLGATMLSALRSGILFIPAILILSHLRGIAGIQEAQPLAVALSFPITILFAITFFRKLPEKDECHPERSEGSFT